MATSMRRVNELVSSKIGDYLTNIKTWGSVMYNALDNGLVGDGVTNDTEALQILINKAIASGRKAIFFPHTETGGQYYVTSLTNADQVTFFGDDSSFVGGYTGKINQLGDWASSTLGGIDRLAATSKFITTLQSYIGLVNVAFMGDNGTRFYVLPKDTVTTGVGGVIKIFGDDYQNNADYRDMGWYFHADQNGDKGHHGNGVFWLNSKVLDGGTYANKNPDIGFSFQDGAIVGGRWVALFNSLARAVLMIGPGTPIHAPSNTEIGLELSKAIALQHTQKLYFFTDETGIANSVRSQSKKMLWSLATGGGEEKYVAGVKKTDLTENTFNIGNALVTSSRRNVLTDTSTIDATGVNRIVTNQPNPNTITSISGGVDGQEIIILNVAGNSAPQKTTIQHNSTIRLKGGTDYALGFNHTLTLICIGSTWYEKCRSENA